MCLLLLFVQVSNKLAASRPFEPTQRSSSTAEMAAVDCNCGPDVQCLLQRVARQGGCSSWLFCPLVSPPVCCVVASRSFLQCEVLGIELSWFVDPRGDRTSRSEYLDVLSPGLGSPLVDCWHLSAVPTV
jgi:hypothetical protein